MMRLPLARVSWAGASEGGVVAGQGGVTGLLFIQEAYVTVPRRRHGGNREELTFFLRGGL